MSAISDLLSSSFDTARGVVNGNSGTATGFSDLANTAPTRTATRQAEIGNERDAVAKRNLIRWFLPETGIVEMYVNPKNIVYNYKKHISTPVRTRGGYSIQYYGEDLGYLSIDGTTGSSGVEGINVLEDVYRNEQISMDAIAIAAQTAREDTSNKYVTGKEKFSGLVLEGVNDIFNTVDTIMETGSTDPERLKPTLASIAFQTEMYWAGWVFRGYFTEFTVTESSDMLGLFNYSIRYTVTQKRGLRLNFMPWHRSAVNGPSYTDPDWGVPYSFGTLSKPEAARTEMQALTRSINMSLQSSRPIK
jgi:hypothetical protein